MKKLNHLLTVAAIAVGLGLSANQLAAQQDQQRQGRGNFDPEQMRQRMAERLREQLAVTSDDEWKVIQPRVEKVTEARREVGGGGGFGMFGGGRQRGGGGDNAQAGADAQGGRRAGGGGRGGFGGEPSPEAEALQKAIDAKASAEEIKAKLAKYRDSRKVKEANLEKAQDDLRKVLSVSQEAKAVLMGLLK